MVLNRKGYVYTALVVVMSLIIISLLFFYTQSSVVVSNDAIGRMQVEEMHYFVESVKSDASRALSISGQRAAVYVTNYVLNSSESLENYSMSGCGKVGYPQNGSEAALAELMVCGTFKGARGEEARYMENHTLLDWVNRTEYYSKRINFNTVLDLRDITIGLYDSSHILVLAYFNILVYDESNQTMYRGENVPITGIIPLDTLEDPMYYLKSGMPPIIRLYKGCDVPARVDGSVLDSWIDSECYLPSDYYYGAPSFFDRLDGRITPKESYVTQARDLGGKLNFTYTGIGLESLVDLEKLASLDVTVNSNNSQVDYMYWNNTRAFCAVRRMSHGDFRIDPEHARKYGVKDFYCTITLTDETSGPFITDLYEPGQLNIPPNTLVYWVNQGSIAHSINIMDAGNQVVGSITIPPGSRGEWLFTTPGIYSTHCTIQGHSGYGVIVVF